MPVNFVVVADGVLEHLLTRDVAAHARAAAGAAVGVVLLARFLGVEAGGLLEVNAEQAGFLGILDQEAFDLPWGPAELLVAGAPEPVAGRG